MADRGPSDYRGEGWGITNWAVLIVFALFALGGLVWAIKPDLIAQATGIVHRPPLEPPARAKPVERSFADLYERYAMAPLDADVAALPDVGSALTILQKEPCDQRAVHKAAATLERAHALRAAAEMMKGFGYSCADASNELHRAGELFFYVGDHESAIRVTSDVIRRHPDVQGVYYLRAKAEQARRQYAAALEDYVTLIRLLPNLKTVRADVFTRMSEAYESLDRPCEAIVPLQTYIALDPRQRTIAPLERRIAELAAKGNCTLNYAKGTAWITRRSAGVPMTRAEINGVPGTFLIDTGASFVTLSRSYAFKAKPTMIVSDRVEMRTANGSTSATLATADVVKLSGLQATGVPAVVTDKDFGNGVDGLLGMSFLSRFAILMEDGQMKLTAKTLVADR